MMKKSQWLAVLTALTAVAVCPAAFAAAEEDGVALAIVYDTSGSMRETVPDKNGAATPKYIIANRALTAVARQIESFATNNASDAPRKIHAGLFIFEGASGKEAIKLAPFDAKALQDWAKNFSKPDGGTPLGNAVQVGATAVINSPLSRKHVLVITDGMNTMGPQPAAVIPKLNQLAERKQTMLSVHFIAFDVAASTFDPVKKLGATVVAAADEQQLNTQLDFILEHKILLEAEEPKK